METRRGPRVKAKLASSCVISEDGVKLAEGNKFAVEIVDISEVGLGIAVNYYLPKGTKIDLEIEGAPFGLSEGMRIKGEICHCVYKVKPKYLCGVKFIELSEEHKLAIRKFVAQYDRRKSPRLNLEK